MRINWVKATSFALLEGPTLRLDERMTLVIGPNRSGKSTWHAALYAALCGFPGLGDPLLPFDHDFRRRRSVPDAEWSLECELEFRGGVRKNVPRDLRLNELDTTDYTTLAGLDRHTYAATSWVDHQTSVASEPDTARLLQTLQARLDADRATRATAWLGDPRRAMQVAARKERAAARLRQAQDERNLYEAAEAEYQQAKREWQNADDACRDLEYPRDVERRPSSPFEQTYDLRDGEPLAAAAYSSPPVPIASAEPDDATDGDVADGDAADGDAADGDVDEYGVSDGHTTDPLTASLAEASTARPLALAWQIPLVVGIAVLGVLGIAAGFVLGSWVGAVVVGAPALAGVIGTVLFRRRLVTSEPIPADPAAADPSVTDAHLRSVEPFATPVVKDERDPGEALSTAGIGVDGPEVQVVLDHYRDAQDHQEPPAVASEPMAVEAPSVPGLAEARADADAKLAVMEAAGQRRDEFNAEVLEAAFQAAQAEVSRLSKIEEALTEARRAFIRGRIVAHQQVLASIKTLLVQNLGNVINSDGMQAEVAFRDNQLTFAFTECDSHGRRHPNLADGPRQAANVLTCLAFSECFEHDTDEHTPLILDDVVPGVDQRGQIRFFDRLLDISRNRQVILFANLPGRVAASWVREKRHAHHSVELVRLKDVHTEPRRIVP